LLSLRRAPRVPLESVVPACCESRFWTHLLHREFPLGEMTMFRLGTWLMVGLAVCMLATQEAKAGVGVGFQPATPD